LIRLRAYSVALFSLFALLGFLLVSIAAAIAETIPVPAGQIKFRSMDLNAEDEVSGRISVVGGEFNDINFTVLGPNGQIVLPTVKVTASNFRFSAPMKGTYRFVFDNSLSLVEKSVSLNYDVKHYWFGLPQEFVLMLIVVFVGVLGLVVYAMMSKS